MARSSTVAAALAAALLTTAFGSRAHAAPESTVLIEFADLHREAPDKPLIHPFEYTFQDWNQHMIDVPRRGVMIKAPSGKGGIGENRTGVEFNGWSSVTLHFVVGGGNHASAIIFSLEDSDGTEGTWRIPLDGEPGREIRQLMDLTKPDSVAKPGKKPGVNLRKVTTWQLKGDFSDPNVEVLLIRLVGTK